MSPHVGRTVSFVGSSFAFNLQCFKGTTVTQGPLHWELRLADSGKAGLARLTVVWGFPLPFTYTHKWVFLLQGVFTLQRRPPPIHESPVETVTRWEREREMEVDLGAKK